MQHITGADNQIEKNTSITGVFSNSIFTFFVVVVFVTFIDDPNYTPPSAMIWISLHNNFTDFLWRTRTEKNAKEYDRIECKQWSQYSMALIDLMSSLNGSDNRSEQLFSQSRHVELKGNNIRNCCMLKKSRDGHLLWLRRRRQWNTREKKYWRKMTAFELSRRFPHDFFASSITIILYYCTRIFSVCLSACLPIYKLNHASIYGYLGNYCSFV